MSTGNGIEADAEWSTEAQPADDRPAVSVSRTSPEKAVFLEEGNTDAWIATDLTVDLEP